MESLISFLKKTFFPLLFLLGCMWLNAEYQSPEPLWQQLGRSFLQGFVAAPYQDTPIDQMLSLSDVALPHPRLEASASHPRMYGKTLSPAQILTRLEQEPYQSWAINMQAAASAYPYDLSQPYLFEGYRSTGAKLNSFCYVITGEQHYLDVAKTALLSIGETYQPTTPEGGESNQGWGDWMQAAIALRQFAVAYDLIYPRLSSEERSTIEDHLTAQIRQINRNYTRIPSSFASVDISRGIGIPKNNHIISITCGVAVATLLLDAPQCQAWLNRALDQLEAGLCQIEDDGTYREGAYYGNYVARELSTLAWHLHQRTGKNITRLPTINRFYRWLIAIQRPDGTYPAFDDAFKARFLYPPLLVGISPWSAEFRALYQRDASSFNPYDPLFAEAFFAWDNHVRPQLPQGQNLAIFPTGGTAIFRDQPHTYGLFLCEPGRPHHTKHDHIEPLAFTLWSGGKELLLDAGYGIGGVNDTDRSWFQASQNHNIPLVNGLGPYQNALFGDAIGSRITSHLQGDWGCYACGEASYGKSDLQRTVLFAHQRYFVVLDQCASAQKQRFSIPWNGNGSWQQTGADQCQWRSGEAILDATFISSQPLRMQPRQSTHTGTNTNLPHTAIELSFPRAQAASLLSVFVPSSPENAPVSTKPITITSGGTAYAIETDDGSVDLFITATQPWECRGFRSDATAAVILQNPQASPFILATACTSVAVWGDTLLSSDVPVDIFIQFGSSPQGQIESHDVSQHPSLRLRTGIDPGSLHLNGNPKTYRQEGAFTCFTLEHSGFIQCSSITGSPLTAAIPPAASQLRWVMDSNRPRETHELLTTQQQAQINHEITAIIAAGCIDSLNASWGENAVQKAYGFLSGISNSIWDASDGFSISLPHSMQFSRPIAHHTMRYREEGTISPKGWKIKYQSFEIDTTLYAQYQHNFTRHHAGSISINHSDMAVYANFERVENQQNWSMAADYQTPTKLLGYRHLWQDASRLQRDEMRLGACHVFTTWARQKNGSDTRYNATGAVLARGVNVHYQAWLTPDEVETISVETALPLGGSNSLIAGFSDNAQQHPSGYGHLYLIHSATSLQGWISVHQDAARGGWKLRHHHRQWNIALETTLENAQSRGTITIDRRSPIWDLHTVINTENTLKLVGTLHPAPQKRIHASCLYDSKKKALKKLGWGTALPWMQGWDVAWYRWWDADVQDEVVLRSTIDCGKNQWLILRNAVAWDAESDVQSYEITVQQFGRTVQPGIVVSKDTDGYMRGKGFISLVF